MSNVKHGMFGTRIYQQWADMHRRCRNPNYKNYDRYGGRGITVCNEWYDFMSFYNDMGDCPAGHQLDRKDNNGNYEPSNCRWVTRSVNTRNRELTRQITINGITKFAPDWADEYGISHRTAAGRIRAGWDPVLAVTAPATGTRHKTLQTRT